MPPKILGRSPSGLQETPLENGHTIWLFAGNDRGGKTASVQLSLIASIKLLSVDPYRYLREVLTRLPQAGPEPDEAFVWCLLPDTWLAAHPEVRLIERN